MTTLTNGTSCTGHYVRLPGDEFNLESKPKTIYEHVLAPDGERWEFRRSRHFIALMFAVLGMAIVILGCLAVFLLEAPGKSNQWLPILLLLPVLDGFLIWIASPGTPGDIPLTVDHQGRVCFGKRELCAPGTVLAVRIIRWRNSADRGVYLEVDGGNLVLVPPHYFGDFELGEDTRPFAEELAKALRVPVMDSV